MATRTKRRRLRREKPRPTSVMIRGGIVGAIALAIGVALLNLYNGSPLTNYQKYYVSTPTVGNLLIHDPVRLSGTRVGQVLKIDIGDDGQPLIELQLDPGTELTTDTRVGVRANGLLGARYIELTPGSSTETLPEGTTLEGDTGAYTFGLPETVATFDEQSREGFQKGFGELGAGLLGNGAALNRAFYDLGYTKKGEPTYTKQSGDLAKVILAREGAAARLFPSIAAGLDPLDRTRAAVGPFTQAAGDAVEPFVSERDATREALEKAGPALGVVEENLPIGGTRLLTAVRSFAFAANTTLPTAPAALTQVSALLDEGRRPLQLAGPLLRATSSAVPGALTILHELDPVIPVAKEGIDTARPILDVVGTYGCDLASNAATLRSMTGFSQAGTGPNGPAMAFRLYATMDGLSHLGVTEANPPGIRRRAYQPPCSTVSTPYPLFFPTPEDNK